ncbi:PREDICTED: uncharacterized protein LOC105450359 [Wasmannia auropunctata]|uniref:uncharacterized protein LOC105450359 n=1 Tax=Wasmannia auropunctata TaxID=64793 RepID=UPI0005EF33CD|nr:PREDICTED: uncharacterized protein LOC105450359 [Wasmannia auropunctata]
MDNAEEDITFEKPKASGKAGKKSEATSRPDSPELEYVSTSEAGSFSRPSTPRNNDVELVSYTPGPRTRRNSESSRASTSKKRKIRSSPEEEEDDDRRRTGKFTDDQRREVEDLVSHIEELSSTDMAALVNEWLGEVEELRRKSQNIKGSFTRKMKVKVEASTEATRILAMRASMDGDVGFLRTKVLEMQSEIKTLKEDNQQLRQQLEDLRSGAPLFANNMEVDVPGMIKSPDPPTEFYSPIAEMSQTMEERPGRDVRRTPMRPRGSPVASGSKGPLIGEDFTTKLTAAIGQAVAAAMREYLPGKEKKGPQLEAGLRRIPERTRLLDRLPSSSAAPESQTDEDKVAYQPAARNRSRKKKSRVTKDAAPRILENKFRERLEEGNAAEGDPPPTAPVREVNKPDAVAVRRGNIETVRRRVPRSAAVTLSFPEGMRFAEVVKRARENVKLEDLGIQHTRLRTTMSGAVLVEIPGKDMSPKADTLAARLRETFRDSGVRVARPTLRGEIRLAGLDASIAPNEIKQAMAEKGGCSIEDIRLGQTRVTRNGFRTVWAQCPLNAAIGLAQEGSLRVGWSTSTVDLLKKRPVQCFKCFATGHVRERCPSTVDRSLNCFNCGAEGHNARNCGRPPDCPICREQGRKHDHRAGSDACPPCPPRGGLSQSPPSPLPQRIPANRSMEAGPSYLK